MIGILGGSFDPVHNGHLAMALLAQQQMQLDNILFVPCQHHAFAKQYQATDAQRIAMLELALAPYPQFRIDTREMQQSEMSYTINTLRSLQKSYPNDALALIVGMDVFASLNQWYEWQQLIEYAVVIVVQRDNMTLADINSVMTEFIKHDQQKKLFFLDNSPIKISATDIRKKIPLGHPVDQVIPEAVMNYIKENKIYEKKY